MEGSYSEVTTIMGCNGNPYLCKNIQDNFNVILIPKICVNYTRHCTSAGKLIKTRGS